MKRIRFLGYFERGRSCCGGSSMSRFVSSKVFNVWTITGAMKQKTFTVGKVYNMGDTEVDFLVKVKVKGRTVFEEVASGN